MRKVLDALLGHGCGFRKVPGISGRHGTWSSPRSKERTPVGQEADHGLHPRHQRKGLTVRDGLGDFPGGQQGPVPVGGLPMVASRCCHARISTGCGGGRLLDRSGRRGALDHERRWGHDHGRNPMPRCPPGEGGWWPRHQHCRPGTLVARRRAAWDDLADGGHPWGRCRGQRTPLRNLGSQGGRQAHGRRDLGHVQGPRPKEALVAAGWTCLWPPVLRR